MSKVKEFTKNMFFSIASNAMNVGVTAITSLLIPLLLGASVEQYGYYQIYVFYTAYIGFFHLGLCDGVLLKEGGKEYCDIEKKDYSFQFYWLCILEIIISFVIICIVILKGEGSDNAFIALAFCINLIIYLPRNLLAYILQATNKIKESSFITIIGRAVYLLGLINLSILHVRNYRCFILADLVGKSIALIYAIIQCRDIVFCKPSNIRKGINVVIENISVGIKLMLASISSMIITGIVQLAIQHFWSVEVYGKVSFTLSMTNLVLTFINAIAIVLYPTLRRVTDATAQALYTYIKSLLMIILMATLIMCCPLQVILIRLLPQYVDGIKYLPILFPVCIFSAKFVLLVQTYMQVYRMEKMILKINIIGILVTIFLTCISALLFRNLTMTVITILIGQIFRCFYAEYILSNRINMELKKECLWEVLLVSVFVGISYYCGMLQGLYVYFPLYCVYVLKDKKDIANAVKYLKTEEILN